MPILSRLTIIALSAVVLSGCGSTSESGPAAAMSEPRGTEESAGQAGVAGKVAAAPTPVTLPVNGASTPSEVVMAFLNAMRDGNSGIAAELLSDQARAETTKHEWPIQPPGAPTATYQLGSEAFVDAAQTGVHIPCLWTEPDGTGGNVQFEVVWALRKLSQGWRVAGFATEVVPGKPHYYFNFEDIANLKETQAAAEAAMADLLGAETAPSEVAGRPASSQPVR